VTTRKGPNDESFAPEDDLSEPERKQILDKLQELEGDFNDMRAQLDPLIESRLRRLAGTHFERMRHSREETLKCLSDADPNLRQAALGMACDYWGIRQVPSSTIEHMAVADPVDEVRESAIRALGNYYARTKDQQIGHLLANFVRNDDLVVPVRLTAFMSLLRLHGMLNYVDDGGRGTSVPSSLEEIDWGFVDRYYHGTHDG
jgi:hypothetical protein